MTTGGQPTSCDLGCTLLVQGKAHSARMRTCSLSRCFVETDQTPKVGMEVVLQVATSTSSTRESQQGIVERSRYECFIGNERVRGIDVRLTEIGPSFFALYSALCDQSESDSTREVTLPLGIVPPTVAKDAPNERRSARRDLRSLPVRAFGGGVDLCAWTRDLSADGAFIESDQLARVGSSLHLEFLGVRSLFVEASVVRCQQARADTPGGFAVRFLSHDEVIHQARAGQVSLDEARQSAVGTARPRMEMELELRIATPEDLGTLFMKQIHKEALFVPGLVRLDSGTYIGVALRFGSAEPFMIHGRVVRCFDSPPGVGLQVLNGEDAAAWFAERLRSPC